MTPQELKNSILQLAIQGKLVEQRPEEGTAEELYRQIQQEKQALIKAGKIKKEKLLPEITENEIPFEIPDNWKWVCLETLADVNGGYAFKSTDYSIDGVRVIRISDFNENGFVDDKIVRHPYKNEFEPFLLEEKNILLCMTGGTVGKSYFVSNLEETMMVNQRVATIKIKVAIPEYININIIAPLIQKIIQDNKNSTNDNISMETIKAFPIPLPPLAEQKRIVARIEELLPYIDRYEKAWNRLEDFNKRFPADMQKSILQLAIQGKLVEQLPEEGTGEALYQRIQQEKQALIKAGKIKKEKPFSTSIAYQEYPFDIPDSWMFVRFGELMISRDSERIPVSTTERQRRKKVYDYYGASGIIDKIDDYLFDKELLLIGEDGANLLARSTPIAFLANGKYWVNNHAHVLDGCSGLCLKYVCYYINAISLAPYVTGTAQPKMNQENMNAIWVALPPLAEQKRIVAKLEELLPLCKRLK